MADPINLRQFRKRRQRAEKEKAADDNRKRHGISSKLRKQAKLTNTASITRLDGKRLTSEE